MKLKKMILFSSLILMLLLAGIVNGQVNPATRLDEKQKAIIGISALTGKGDLSGLTTELNRGLDAGLTVNQIREVIVHVYAYAGFPRSIRGLQTFMSVLEERKSKGMDVEMGREATPVKDERSKYQRGKAILDTLLGAPQPEARSGYAAFAPVIEIFLKEHLFADIFERDVLTYAERELATISVLAGIGRAEPMLQSHLKICLNVGLTPDQLTEFLDVIKQTAGRKEARSAISVWNEVSKKK